LGDVLESLEKQINVPNENMRAIIMGKNKILEEFRRD